MAIKIDITKVEASAQQIASYNSRIRDDFMDIKNALNNLNKNWDGCASDSAFSAFDNIQDSYCDFRYSIINDLVSFLKIQVGSDYLATEAKIKSVADAFK